VHELKKDAEKKLSGFQTFRDEDALREFTVEFIDKVEKGLAKELEGGG